MESSCITWPSSIIVSLTPWDIRSTSSNNQSVNAESKSSPINSDNSVLI